MSTTFAPAATILVMLVATVVTSVALGTNLWKVYSFRVAVDSTNKPNPLGKSKGTPVIVTVLFPTVPLAIVTVVPVRVYPCDKAPILKIAA